MFNCFRWIFLSLKGNLYYGCSHGFVIALYCIIVFVDTSGVLCLHRQRRVSGTIPSYDSVQRCRQTVLQSPALLIQNGMNAEQNPILVIYIKKTLKNKYFYCAAYTVRFACCVKSEFQIPLPSTFPFSLRNQGVSAGKVRTRIRNFRI